MKVQFLFISFLIFIGCKSLELPSIEESEHKIEFCSSRVNEMNNVVNVWNKQFSFDNDLMIKCKKDGINKLFKFFEKNNRADINIYFLKKSPIISEQKNLFGLQYYNFVGIDTGSINMNIKKLQCLDMSDNKLSAEIEIEGKGNIKISGRHTGIPASASPDIELYLNETVGFDTENTSGDFIILTPQKKKLKLQSKFYIKLLKWQIPWSQEIPIELTDLMKRIIIPVSIQRDISFPFPSQTADTQQQTSVPYILILSNVKIIADKEILDFRTDIDFRKK